MAETHFDNAPNSEEGGNTSFVKALLIFAIIASVLVTGVYYLFKVIG